MLTHFNLYANALQGEAWMAGAEYRKEIFYAILPMFHAFGMTLYLTYGIRKQGLLVLFPKFDSDLVLDAMKKSPADRLLRGPADLRAHRDGREGEGRLAAVLQVLHLRRHEPAGPRVELWESSPAACWWRATA